ncbi:MAG: hypothetical protein K6T83_22755 [Alicyclobacillus sp.]|nr:hypothetical protein [Alicyclobacillus sp.]
MADPSWLYSSDKVGMYGVNPTTIPVVSVQFYLNTGYFHGLTTDPTVYSQGTSNLGGNTSTDIVTNTSCSLGGQSTGTYDVVMTGLDPLLQSVTIPAGSLLFLVPSFYCNFVTGGAIAATGNARLSYVTSSNSVVDLIPMTTNNPLYLNNNNTGSGYSTVTPQIAQIVSSSITIPKGSRWMIEIKLVISTATVNSVSVNGAFARIPIQPGM